MEFLIILIDILLLLIVGVTVVRYYQKGFFASLISLVGTIVSVILALLLSTPIATFIFGVFMEGSITARVDSSLSDDLPEQSVEHIVSGLTDAFPDSLTVGVDGLNAVDELNSIFAGEMTGVTSDVIVSNTVAPVMIALTAAIIFFFLVFVFKGIFGIVEKLLYGVNKLAIVGKLNNVLGGVVGIVPGIVNAILVFAVLILIAVFTADQIPVLNSTDLDSTVGGTVFNSLLSAVSGFFTPQ